MRKKNLKKFKILRLKHLTKQIKACRIIEKLKKVGKRNGCNVFYDANVTSPGGNAWVFCRESIKRPKATVV